jgi:hypothetical protein
MKQFGVGQSTIREEVRVLVHSGLLEKKQGFGTFLIANSRIRYERIQIGWIAFTLNVTASLFSALDWCLYGYTAQALSVARRFVFSLFGMIEMAFAVVHGLVRLYRLYSALRLFGHHRLRAGIAAG